jgi:hypothetical protein
MGYQATCTLTIDGRRSRGTAWLEHKDLVFRGPHRLVVPLNEITDARADGATLHVSFSGRSATFDLEEPAGKWAKRITNPPSRADKLGIKPGTRVTLLGIRDEDFEREVAARGAVMTRRVPASGVDLLFYAANTHADLARIKELVSGIAPDGALWIVRPKGRPEITEAETMAAGKSAGLVDVKVVSFSETHTAEKFVVRRSSRPLRTASAVTRPAAIPARSRRFSSPAPRKS